MIEEEFSLGDSDFDNLQDDFSLGSVEETVKNNQFKESSQFSEIQQVYDLLRVEELKGVKRLDDEYFNSFFKADAGVFLLLGKDNFEAPSKTEIEIFSRKKDDWIEQAKNIWRGIDNQYKLENFTLALQNLENLYQKFCFQPASTTYYAKEIQKNLTHQLNSFLNQKIKDDKILDIIEIQELLDFAVSIHLISGSESEKNQLLQKIKTASAKQVFSIESFSETFTRLVSELPELERLDTEPTKEKLFAEYKKLAEIHNQVSADKVSLERDSLFLQMYDLLIHKNLLIDNVSFYTENFFNAERTSGKFNFSLPIVEEEYYYLKGTAHNVYHFSESQWKDFVRKNGIIRESDASVAFIMGTEKASTISEIATLLEENPNMALSRIRAGDVETYLIHIRQLDMAKKLSAIKETLKNDTDILVQSVVNLLRGKENTTENTDESVSASDSLFPLIESGAAAEEIVSYLLRRKQYENLNRKVLSPNIKDHHELEDYLVSKGFSFIKICMNYLHQFPLENNALAYKNMYETYAAYVLSELASENDFMTFVCVFKPVLEEIDKTEYLSADFIKKYDEIETQMIKKFDEKKSSQQIELENKPKKSFLWFKK